MANKRPLRNRPSLLSFSIYSSGKAPSLADRRQIFLQRGRRRFATRSSAPWPARFFRFVGRFKAPARSNAGKFPDSLEGCVSGAGVVFGTRAGAGFWVTLAARAGGDAGAVFAAGVWTDGGGVVDACCFDGFADRIKRKTPPITATKTTTAPMATSGQGLKDLGA